MDEQDTAGYTEPCPQCSDVCWGISEEGRFYCLSCHTVVERSREVEERFQDRVSNRVSRISKGAHTKRADRGYRWMICEAFQFILKNQADALLELGVSPGFKDLVLCRMWRIYLQRSQQAYTNKPKRHGQAGTDSEDSAAESSVRSTILSESNPASDAHSQAESGSDQSCSMDADSYLQKSQKNILMTMKRTLALIYLALVWSREALTLSDLLRLVQEGHVPYVKAFEKLPEQMKLMGKDTMLFRVERIPSYRVVHQDSGVLAQLLQLPAFPPISHEMLLHPAQLSLRYLTEVNLPDELHPWVCRLMERADMVDPARHTFDSTTQPILPYYDLQAAALVIVTMKVFFGLDDRTEWDLSNRVKDSSEECFNPRKWYRLMQTALVRGQQSDNRAAARKQWKPKKLIFRRRADKYVAVKKKRTAEHVQVCFERLSSCPVDVQPTGPSSFRFCWGDEDGSDGPSMHHMKLDGFLTLKDDIPTPFNCSYWHQPLQPCQSRWCTPDHFLSEMEPLLPKSFKWLLQLFSFLLRLEPSIILREVLSVERRVFGTKTPCPRGIDGVGPSPWIVRPDRVSSRIAQRRLENQAGS